MVKKSELEAQFKNDPFKMELLKSEGDEVAAFKMGDFVDFGFAALLPNSGKVKHFKLLSVAGAYWQGKSSNPMLQDYLVLLSLRKQILKQTLSVVLKLST